MLRPGLKVNQGSIPKAKEAHVNYLMVWTGSYIGGKKSRSFFFSNSGWHSTIYKLANKSILTYPFLIKLELQTIIRVFLIRILSSLTAIINKKKKAASDTVAAFLIYYFKCLNCFFLVVPSSFYTQPVFEHSNPEPSAHIQDLSACFPKQGFPSD